MALVSIPWKAGLSGCLSTNAASTSIRRVRSAAAAASRVVRCFSSNRRELSANEAARDCIRTPPTGDAACIAASAWAALSDRPLAPPAPEFK